LIISNRRPQGRLLRQTGLRAHGKTSAALVLALLYGSCVFSGRLPVLKNKHPADGSVAGCFHRGTFHTIRRHTTDTKFKDYEVIK
jgi:hypothetical protein